MADLSYLLPYATNDIVPATKIVDTTQFYLLGDIPGGNVFVLPKVTTDERNSLNLVKKPGFLVYNKDTSIVEIYATLNVWAALVNSGGGGGTYVLPTFASFSIIGQATTLEVGATSNSDPNFTWTTTTPENINSNSINITDTTASLALVTGHSSTPPASSTQSGLTKTSATSEVYQIVGTNTQSTTFNRSFSIAWLWEVFYGETSTTPLIESDIHALRANGLQYGFAGTYSFAASPSQYKYICYPTVYGTATMFKDQSTNLTVPFNAPYVVSVTNSFSVTTNYNVHRSVNMIGGALVVVVY